MDIHSAYLQPCNFILLQLHLIHQIRKFLSPESMKTLVHVFVTSHLDYCNSLLFGIPKYQTDRLQKVVNNIARLIFRIPKFDHISSNLSHLHWEEYLQPHSISGHHLRSGDQGLFKIPKPNFKTFGDHTLAHSGPLLWNKLLLEIQNSQSVAIFKSKLKTQLFKLA